MIGDRVSADIDVETGDTTRRARADATYDVSVREFSYLCVILHPPVREFPYRYLVAVARTQASIDLRTGRSTILPPGKIRMLRGGNITPGKIQSIVR
jgi:hypothetical protein